MCTWCGFLQAEHSDVRARRRVGMHVYTHTHKYSRNKTPLELFGTRNSLTWFLRVHFTASVRKPANQTRRERGFFVLETVETKFRGEAGTVFCLP